MVNLKFQDTCVLLHIFFSHFEALVMNYLNDLFFEFQFWEVEILENESKYQEKYLLLKRFYTLNVIFEPDFSFFLHLFKIFKLSF